MAFFVTWYETGGTRLTIGLALGQHSHRAFKRRARLKLEGHHVVRERANNGGPQSITLVVVHCAVRPDGRYSSRALD